MLKFLILVRILSNHPQVEIIFLGTENTPNTSLKKFDNSINSNELPLTQLNRDFDCQKADTVFLALPHGISNEYVKLYYDQIQIIDLSADFRLKKSSEYLKWYKQKHKATHLINKSLYSLPEINGKNLNKYQIISCPGCYPTSILLPLIPLFKNNLVKTKNITIDSKSGYSGAGRGVHKKYKDKNLYESLSAYGVGFHRHNSEIDQMLKKFTKKQINFNFTPHLTPMFRGILSTIYIDLETGINQSKVIKKLSNFYKKDSFVKIMKADALISTNDVINSNNCFISVCKTKYKDKIIILSVIDNLIKGGAGQAIQNLNIKFNFPLKTALK